MNTCVVLLAHGSAVRDWQQPFDDVVMALRSEFESADVRIAYLQFAEPTLLQVVRDAWQDGAQNLVVLPLFLSRGKHMQEDVPALVADAIRRYPGLPVRVLPPIGEDARFWDLIKRLVAERLQNTAPRRSVS